MISAIHGMAIPAASGGGTPVFVQSAKVMFIADGSFRTDTNWNTVDQNTTNGALVNNSGASIGWEITVPATPDWDIDPNVTNSGNADFSAMALRNGVYTYVSGQTKTITFSSLDSSKLYKVKIASLVGYDDTTMRTMVTVSGVTKALENNTANTIYQQDFDVAASSSSVVISVSPDTGETYGFFCAIILEEYSTS